ncbi:hypothetical protein [Sphingomonas daechungensis]|uniref:hypothetical protein n=1 Tax=Sphingomonas daechungensis TaxID=1176646 RepID=UPI003783C31D
MTPDLTALEEAAKRLKEAFEGGGPFKAEMEVYRGISGPSAILSLISTIRSLERERDEAFKAGMLRAAAIVEQVEVGFENAANKTKPIRDIVAAKAGAEAARFAATSIRAEAERSGG